MSFGRATRSFYLTLYNTKWFHIIVTFTVTRRFHSCSVWSRVDQQKTACLTERDFRVSCFTREISLKGTNVAVFEIALYTLIHYTSTYNVIPLEGVNENK